jgi:hypothetical protein
MPGEEHPQAGLLGAGISLQGVNPRRFLRRGVIGCAWGAAWLRPVAEVETRCARILRGGF